MYAAKIKTNGQDYAFKSMQQTKIQLHTRFVPFKQQLHILRISTFHFNLIHTISGYAVWLRVTAAGLHTSQSALNVSF